MMVLWVLARLGMAQAHLALPQLLLPLQNGFQGGWKEWVWVLPAALP